MHISNDGIYILFDHSLLKVGLYLKDSLRLMSNQPPWKFTDIRAFDDKLWVKSQMEKIIMLFSFKNGNADAFTSIEGHLDNPGFAITGEHIVMTGTSSSGQISMYGYHLSQTQNNYLWPDIELVDFEISNISYKYFQFRVPDDSFAIITNFDFDTSLTIRNNGSDVINSVSVFSPRSGGFNCTKQFYYKTFDNLLLQPGAEMVIEFGRSNEFSPPKINHEICFEVLAPDNLLELYVQSNTLCKSFNIANVKNPAILEGHILFPNPASGRIYFRNVAPGTFQAELADICGRVVSVITDMGSQDHFALDGLPAGLYIVRFISARNIVTRKFIRTE